MPKFTDEMKQEANLFLAENLLLPENDGEKIEIQQIPNYIEDYRPVLGWLCKQLEIHGVELSRFEDGASVCRLTYFVDGSDDDFCKKMFSAFIDEPFQATYIAKGDTIGEVVCLAAAHYLHEVKGKE